MTSSPSPILVTGGAGFIGANFVLQWISETGTPVVNLDKLTYAGNLANLASVHGDPRHAFVQGDIGDAPLVAKLLAEHRPAAVGNFAAESHVDRSIHGAGEFIQTNVLGTFRLLESVRHYWQALPAGEKDAFRFLHVSTDEVYGSLGPADPAFTERHNYRPHSPDSASNAGADARARGSSGEAYHIGGDCERANLDVVRAICRALDEFLPGSAHRPHERLIAFVPDRPGHDRRYAIDTSKVKRELGWQPAVTFEQGLKQTVRWYLDHEQWVRGVQSGEYRNWIAANHTPRQKAA